MRDAGVVHGVRGHVRPHALPADSRTHACQRDTAAPSASAVEATASPMASVREVTRSGTSRSHHVRTKATREIPLAATKTGCSDAANASTNGWWSAGGSCADHRRVGDGRHVHAGRQPRRQLVDPAGWRRSRRTPTRRSSRRSAGRASSPTSRRPGGGSRPRSETARTSTCITIPRPSPSSTMQAARDPGRRAHLEPGEQEDGNGHDRRAGDRERLVAARARDQRCRSGST